LSSLISQENAKTALRHKDVLVLVPTFNDRSEIAAILDELRRHPRTQALLIDDGSTVGLDEVVSGRDALHLRLPGNYGLGVCMHVALDHAIASGYSAMARIDADGQHSVADIDRLLTPLAADHADVVFGVRTNHGGGAARQAVKLYFSLVSRLLTRGAAPDDVNSGFIALNRVAMSILNSVELERYPEPQIVIVACRRDLRTKEVPVTQGPRRTGQSTLGLAQALRMVYRFSMFALGELLSVRRP
jgi:glycosyltransferase involved in cell wall biosynthesis